MIRFGALPIDGRPLVAVSFTQAAGIEAARADGMDIAELRVDGFRRGDPAFAIEVARAFAGIPTLATIRLAEEGGGWAGGEEAREALFRALLPYVDAVDIELRAAPLIARLALDLKSAGKALVVSHHDFEKTPPRESLREVAARALAAGADIVKIATLVERQNDLLTLASLLTDPVAPDLVVIGMGEKGALSRVEFPALGSRFTFAANGEVASAPGQLLLKRTVELVKGPRSAPSKP